MKALLAVFLLLSVAACSIDSEASETSLVEALTQFNDAFEEGDVQKLSSLLSSDYVHTNGSWKSFGKEKWLGYMTDRSSKIDNGNLIIESYEMDELAIEMHDDAAIVTALISTTGIEDGVQFDKKFRVSNFWIFDGSRWLRAGFHDTSVD